MGSVLDLGADVGPESLGPGSSIVTVNGANKSDSTDPFSSPFSNKSDSTDPFTNKSGTE